MILKPRDVLSSYWHAYPDYFAGHRVFVTGGGPSLKSIDPWCLRNARIIACNNAGIDLFPWADVLLWSDPRWLEWNVERLHLHHGPLKVRRGRMGADSGFDIKVMRRDIEPPLSVKPDTLAGYDTGAGGINLAYLMGARDIILLGFDMNDPSPERWRDGNYHSDHRIPPPQGQRAEHFIPSHERMAAALAERGVRVRNATPGSALKAYEVVDLADVLPADGVLTRIEAGLIDPVVGTTMLELGNKRNARGVYKAWFQARGVDHVSVDLNGKDGALPLDLQRPLGLGRFDMVTNFGTTEHVERQEPAWRNVVEATGKVLVCTTPAPGGWKPPHGRWYPTPEFYVDLARLNGFRLDRLYIDGLHPEKLLVCARMERMAEAPFVMPDMRLIEDQGDFGVGEAA